MKKPSGNKLSRKITSCSHSKQNKSAVKYTCDILSWKTQVRYNKIGAVVVTLIAPSSDNKDRLLVVNINISLITLN